MKQLGTSFSSRRPIYRRRGFWLAVAGALIVALGAAAYLLAKQYPAGEANAKTGKIEISTEPSGATITLDGKRRDKKSPTSLTAAEGDHTVKLELANFDSQDVAVHVREGQTYKLFHAFTQQGRSVLPSAAPGQPAFLTYKNDKYGYQIDYPSSWTVNTDGSGVAHFYSKDVKQSGEDAESLAILVQPNPGNLAPEPWYKAREEYPAEDQSQITQRSLTVNGQPGYQYETPYGFVPTVITVVTGKSQAWLLQQKRGSPDRQIYDQIIQTFKLL